MLAAYQLQLDRLRNPSLRGLWIGTVDTGLSLSRGNADAATLSDRYISNPIIGTKANDVLLSSGLRVTFGR